MMKSPRFTPCTQKRPSSQQVHHLDRAARGLELRLELLEGGPGRRRPGLDPGQRVGAVALRGPQARLEQTARGIEDGGPHGRCPAATSWWASASVRQEMAALLEAYTEA